MDAGFFLHDLDAVWFRRRIFGNSDSGSIGNAHSESEAFRPMLLHAYLDVPDRRLHSLLAEALTEAGTEVHEVEGGPDLAARLAGATVDLVIFAVDQAGVEAGAEALARVAELAALPDRPALLPVVSEENAALRAEMLAGGCMAVLNGGLPPALLQTAVRAMVGRLARRWRPAAEPPPLPIPARRASDAPPDLASPSMSAVLATADRVAAADSTVFLLGETGVGKEWVARRIHAASRRRDQPFVAINCAAVPEALLESELFGHVKGAFTGALRDRRGHFEMAHGGTLFLDEIAEMPPHLQGKLLRVVQDLMIQRVGSEETLKVDVRLIAATSRGPEAALADGSFRADLYYRLAVVTLTLPPLRQRPEDVEVLARHYLAHFARQAGRGQVDLPEPVLGALRAYPWPGNVRELINVMERAVVLGEGDELRLADLPVEMRAGAENARVHKPEDQDLGRRDAPEPPAAWMESSLRQARQAAAEWIEEHHLRAALRTEGGRVGATADRLGITPRALHGKMKRHGLRKEDFR